MHTRFVPFLVAFPALHVVDAYSSPDLQLVHALHSRSEVAVPATDTYASPLHA